MNFGSTVKRNAIMMLAALIVPVLLAGSVQTTTPRINLPSAPGADHEDSLSATVKLKNGTFTVPNGIRGIDVSIYQGVIDWSRVAQDNVEFAIVRASFGQEADKNFYTNVNGASENGIYVGAYHYAKWTDRSSMLKEADFFLNMLDGVSDKITYPIFLDLENNRGNNTRSVITDLSVEFMEIVKAKGYTVMLYSFNNYFRDAFVLSKLDSYDFWVANYIAEPNYNQKIWQYSSTGSVDGITGHVDLNLAYEDLSLRGRSSRQTVSRTVSDSIKATMNERHGSGLPMDGLDMSQMRSAVVTALQSELVRQLDAALDLTGEMNEDTLNTLEQVPFTYGETSGNITYLVQVMLFYKGHYTQDLTGAYDNHTRQALQAFQQDIDIDITGEMDRATLWYLFR